MKSGFTLIELLVVIALFSLLAGVGAEIFAPMVRSYNKSNIQNEINQNGNYALSLIAEQVRNARRIISYSSDSVNSSIQIEDYDSNLITFDRGQDGTGCQAGHFNGFLRLSRVGQNPLTNSPISNIDKKKGVNIESLVIDVARAPGVPDTVSIRSTLAQACAASGTIDYSARATFSTTVTLRNY